MWPKKYRGKSLAIYGIACWTGPCIAPIGGAYIAGNLNWRWIFWSISVLCVCIQLSAFFLLNEAYEPVLLERKARRIRKQLQAEEKPSYTRSPKDTHTVVRSKHHVKGKFKKVVLSRFCLAFTMMFTHPACYLPSLFRAYLYGLMYLLLAAWDSVWEDIYHQSKENGSLNYLSPLTGLMVSLYMTSNIIDTVSVPLISAR